MPPTLPFSTPGYRNGDTAACEKCGKPVQVKFFTKGQVVVLPPAEQSQLALRCQGCGAVVCDDCAHPKTSIFPVCPQCQREWGPYYFTQEDDGVFPAQKPAQPASWTPALGHAPVAEISVAKEVAPPPKEAASKKGSGRGFVEGDLRSEFGADKTKPPLLPRIDFQWGRMVKTTLALLALLALLAAAVFTLGPLALRQVREMAGASPTPTPALLTSDLFTPDRLSLYAGQRVFAEGVAHASREKSSCGGEPASPWCTAYLTVDGASLFMRLPQGQPINSITSDFQLVASDGRLIPANTKVQVTGVMVCEADGCRVDVDVMDAIWPATPTKSPTPRPTTTRTPTVTLTPATAATNWFSATITVTLESGPLPGTEIPTAAPTVRPSSSGCREATSITTADVGQTLCIEGVVLAVKKQEIDRTTKAYIYTFSPEKGAFYVVVYGYPLPNITKDVCMRLTSQVRLLGTAPVMVPTASEVVEICP